MSFKEHHYTTVTCDECGHQVDTPWINKHDIKARLRPKGWSFGKRHLCPSCSGKAVDYLCDDCANDCDERRVIRVGQGAYDVCPRWKEVRDGE